MKEILDEFAAGVDVPAPDVAAGRATRVSAIAESPDSPPLIYIHSGPAPPADAYSTVYYQDEMAPELTGHGLPLIKCEAYNRVYEQHYGSS
jgi:hypothetical protein